MSGVMKSINRTTSRIPVLGSIGRSIEIGTKIVLENIVKHQMKGQTIKPSITSKLKELDDKLLDITYKFDDVELSQTNIYMIASKFMECHNKNLKEIKEDKDKLTVRVNAPSINKPKNSIMRSITRIPYTLSRNVGIGINGVYNYVLHHNQPDITLESLHIKGFGQIIGEIEVEGNTRYIQTKVMDGKTLTDINAISSELSYLLSLHNSSSETYAWTINKFHYFYVNNSTSGGCIKTQKGGPPDKPGTKVFEDSKYKLFAYKSENNNCLLVLIAHFFNINSHYISTTKVRTALNLEPGTMIGIEEVPRVFEYYNQIHKGNGGRDKGFILSNESMNILKFKKPKNKDNSEEEFNVSCSLEDEEYETNNKKDMMNIMLYREHYYQIEFKHKIECNKCMKSVYVDEEGKPNKHKCNINVASYVNDKLKLFLKNQKNSKYDKLTGKYEIDVEKLDDDEIEKLKYVLSDNRYVTNPTRNNNNRVIKEDKLFNKAKKILNTEGNKIEEFQLSYRVCGKISEKYKEGNLKNKLYRSPEFNKVPRLNNNKNVEKFLKNVLFYEERSIKATSYIYFTYNKEKTCINMDISKLNNRDREQFKNIFNSLTLDEYEENQEKKGKEKPEGILHFDFETTNKKNENNRKHKIYCVGYWLSITNEYKYIYYKPGRDVLDDFMNELENISKEYEEYNITLSAYNGSGYDFHFIMDWLNNKKVVTDGLIIKDRRILNLKFWNYKLFDLCNFLMCKLSKACEDFNISSENAKSEFDHNKIIEIEDSLKYKDEITEYLRRDVMGLAELYNIFYKLMYDVTKQKINESITISSFCYKYWTSTVHDMIEIPSYRKYIKYILPATYGARCNPFSKYYKSEYYEEAKLLYTDKLREYDELIQDMKDKGKSKKEIKEIKKKKNIECADDLSKLKELYNKILISNKFKFNADVTSLYPTSCRGIKVKIPKMITTDIFDIMYPVGKSSEITGSEECERAFRQGKLGFYYIKYEPKNKDMIFPPLPSSRYENNRKVGVKYDLLKGEGFYTSVDIQNALDCDYDIKFGEEALIYESKGKIFEEYINKFESLKKQSEVEENEAKRACMKLCLNGLYGKQLERCHTEETKIISTIEEFDKFLIDNELTDFYRLSEGKYVIIGDKKYKEELVNKPSQNGAFILSYSRSIMLNFMKMCDKDLKEHVVTYSDTDSLHLMGELYENLKSYGVYKSKKDSEFGLLCNDCDGEGLILREINLGPKNYLYESLDEDGNLKTTNKCKGIPSVFLKPELYYNETPETIEFDENKKTTMRRVGIKPNRKQIEQGLTPFSIITISDMKRTFNKNTWKGWELIDNDFYPKGHIKCTK